MINFKRKRLSGAQKNRLILRLIEIVGEDAVLTDPSVLQTYGKDLTRLPALPMAIVFPQKEQQVVGLVQLANECLLPLVPSGGRTGYSGGAVARIDEVVVSFERMNQIVSFNKEDRQLTCQAGITVKTIQELAREHGLFYPVDYAAIDLAQIGGTVSTNAGGINVIHYGSTRRWIAGLKVVTGKGDLLTLNAGLLKSTAGYDFRHLFIGAEGTLGLITEVIVQLTSPPNPSRTAFLTVPNQQNFIKILTLLRRALIITSFEFFDHASMQSVCQANHLISPFKKDAPFYVLFNYEASDIKDAEANEKLQECAKSNLISEYLWSQNDIDVTNFWRFRIGISRSLQVQCPYKYDISVLPSRISSLMEALDHFFSSSYPHLKTVSWGHVGDGNIHLNVLNAYSHRT